MKKTMTAAPAPHERGQCSGRAERTARAERGAMRWAALLGAACWLLPAVGQAQIVNYNEALANYKDAQKGDIELHDKVSVQVAAKSLAAKSLRESRILSARALEQADGSLKLPGNQQNVVIRTHYNDVTRGADGSIRIASPQIDGNVSGTVILYVDGKAPENITLVNP
ncbi:MAG: hypothetical protein Q4A28_05365 [Brachymonas sp.]|nr:hypothetical protein [Brachymonas sp.]